MSKQYWDSPTPQDALLAGHKEWSGSIENFSHPFREYFHKAMRELLTGHCSSVCIEEALQHESRLIRFFAAEILISGTYKGLLKKRELELVIKVLSEGMVE